MAEQKITIRNENDAWDLLERALRGSEGEFDPSEVELNFDGWPHIEISLKGERYHSNISTSVMRAVLELQSAVYAGYAEAVRKTTDGRSLTKEERQKLEIFVSVHDGSSRFDIDLTEVIKNFWSESVGRMSGNQVVVTVVALALVAGGHLSYKAYLDHQAKLHEMEHQVEMSQQETERLEILREAMEDKPAVQDMQENADDFRERLLKSAPDAEQIRIGADIKLSGQQALEYTRAKREKSTEVRVDGDFRVYQVDSSSADSSLKLKLHRVSDNLEFVASADITRVGFDGEEVLKQAVFHKQEIYLAVNARELRGQYTNASIIKVGSEEPTDDTRI